MFTVLYLSIDMFWDNEGDEVEVLAYEFEWLCIRSKIKTKSHYILRGTKLWSGD